MVPPKQAPNILLIITDDAGFGVPSTFGGVIPTPAMDRVAENGLRYHNIHSTALCSPTRAALITGRNHHSAGFGVISEQSTGFPGYNSIIAKDKATIGRILLNNGYATAWFGKDHNTPAFEASQVGPFDQWPIGMGFEYFYGFVGGDANQWQPNLFRNTTQIYPFEGKPGWNLTTGMADDAIDYLHRTNQILPSKPFFIIEMFGQWALYHEGWLLSTKVNRAPWEAFGPANPDPLNNQVLELYDLTKDFSQSQNLADKHPDKVEAMKKVFIEEAEKYQVFPMDASVAARIVAPRPNITAGRTEFVYTRPMTGLPQGDSPMLLNSSYTITADIEVPQGGAEGMILTSGGRFADYGFYLLKGKPVFLWNLVDLKRIKWEGPDALAPGKHTVEFDFQYDGLGVGTLAFNNMSGLARGGTGTLEVDGKTVATNEMKRTLPMILQWDESFDIGSDTLTGVNDADYKPPFTFTGKLDKLTIQVDRPELSPEDIKKLRAAQRNNKVSE